MSHRWCRPDPETGVDLHFLTVVLCTDVGVSQLASASGKMVLWTPGWFTGRNLVSRGRSFLSTEV